MVRSVSRRLFLGFVGAGLGHAVVAAPPTASLRPMARGGDHFKKAVADPEAIIAAAQLNGRVVYAVADPRTGKMLEGINSKVGTPPASVLEENSNWTFRRTCSTSASNSSAASLDPA